MQESDEQRGFRSAYLRVESKTFLSIASSRLIFNHWDGESIHNIA